MQQEENKFALTPVQSALTEFEKVSAGLTELAVKYANVVFDVKTTKGMDEAKAARLAIREPRYAVQRATKSAKDELNAIKKNVEERGAQIAEALLKIETPIDKQIRVEEERKGAEKARKEQAERERVEAIQAAIASISAIPLNVVDASSTYIKQALDDLSAIEITEEHYAEFTPHAGNAKQEAVSKLTSMYDRAVIVEAERAALKAQQEELDRVRAQVEAEMAAQRAEIERQKAELEAARTAAEAARLAEQQRINDAAARAAAAEAEREEAERRLAAAKQVDAFDGYAPNPGDNSAVINLSLLPENFKQFANTHFPHREEVKPAEEPAPHVNIELPIDVPVIDNVGSCPTDLEIVKTIADAFDVSLTVALDWITSINVQAVVEAIAEAA